MVESDIKQGLTWHAKRISARFKAAVTTMNLKHINQILIANKCQPLFKHEIRHAG
jgi:hypothetical protein